MLQLPSMTFALCRRHHFFDLGRHIYSQPSLPTTVSSSRHRAVVPHITKLYKSLSGNPEDIAKEKARLAANQVKGPVLVEDIFLYFNALKGLSGPYI
ncbi:unnamed protein product [Lactuca virosa]|uniref:Uncharacterized protein n=1 Tax=Lactuca virosa TaxID=75947 RepID=A0AAU9PYG1_9ASTR|nr:unnamed protein product [Lactuca virosa]